MTDEEEHARIADLIKRIRHLTPTIRAEGWLTYTRLVEELLTRVERKHDRGQ